MKNNGFDINPEEFAFALDLRLFKNDYEKIMHKEIIESMKLASDFQEEKYSYYLYTSFRYDNQFVSNWKEKAKEQYKVDSEVWSSMTLLKCDEKAQPFKELVDACTIFKGEGDKSGVAN